MKPDKILTKDEGQQWSRENIEMTGNTIKNPDDWKTGDEPLTGAQNSYLHTLASEAHEEIVEGMSKAEASKKIDELRQKTGRGTDPDQK